MTKKYNLIFFIVSLIPSSYLAQTIDSLLPKNIPISITGYVDGYYAYYTDSLGTGDYQKFPSVSPRSNQFGLNTICLNFSYDAEKVRAIAGLHFGDIQRSAWNGNVMEAHAGVRIMKKLWLDAGFFRTHFGTEGLLPKENIANSVSLCTYYEPYFESGIRLNYNPSEKLVIYLYLLNGYNIYEENNDKKSFGALVTYALGDKGNIGYSNYIGDDTPKGDSVGHNRIMQNLFFNYQVKKLKIQVGGDYGIQQHSVIADTNRVTKKSASMYSGVASLKYELATGISVYGRGEMFNDPDGFLSGVIIDKSSMYTGLKSWGATLGVEYKPTDNSYIRLEGRKLTMDKDQEIFYWDHKSSYSRFEVMFNVGVSF
jgi:opacity protein-like surface antigen